MRLTLLPPLLLLAPLLGCGADPFTVEDAVGVWDLQRFNGREVPGDRPVGVPVRANGGADSTVTVLGAFSLEFLSGSGCSWTFYDGISSTITQDDCEYAVDADGVVSLDLVGLFGALRSVSGTGKDGILTLTDQDTNVFELGKR
jgi:hypothetical protein